ncbi:hypothetical protein AKJ09_04424 [Labilithrix luteola]|uniref:Fatty acid desaturase domain-containing protein n=1 Tax=Labilithrix luteola TaxID=1391654 RepID=A0A0K1PW65_9BACT|nr:fatty acid desaturase [Labilithrix luteola]AKU97760.1 hypothetical protein AKJ09_04424 [Labilithrix luteola]
MTAVASLEESLEESWIAPELQLSDPTYEAAPRASLLERIIVPLINDKRDVPFVKLALAMTLMVIPFAAYLFIPGHFRWWLGVAYLAFTFLVFVDRCILMLHNTSHRPLFKSKVLNLYIPWVLGPFFGESPETYYAHHLGMHHAENNLAKDLSSTMRYQRDSFLAFLHYWGTFMLTTAARLPLYLQRHGKSRLARRMLIGELLFLVACGVGLYLSFWPTFTVFVAPWLAVRFLMMWGNWGQHAFLDRERPDRPHTNSITCINSRYNRRCFNDGYHIGHHLMAARHWTDLPGELQKNQARYAKEGAIVFEGIDFFMVSLFLFLKRHDWLADRYVQLGGERKSKQEIILLLKDRLRPFAS